MTNTPIVRPPFVPFDEQKAMRIYQRNLPHWRQEGVTYFVTFRLADSIPDHVRREWEEEKRNWLTARGIVYDGEHGRWRQELEKLSAQEQFRFQQHFNQAVQTCLDRGLGCCALNDAGCLAEVRSALFSHDGDKHHLGDFVVMPNHVHMLITPVVGQELEMIMKGIKGSSAVACNRVLGKRGTFWQADSHDHIVRSVVQLIHYRQYTADNPQKAGISLPAAALYRAEWMDDWLKQ